MRPFIFLLILALAAPTYGDTFYDLSQIPTQTLAGPEKYAPCVVAPESKTPVEKIADDLAKDMVWIGVASGADLFSTSLALRRCPSCYESNKLTPDVESRVALKAMAFPASMGVLYLMRRHGMKREATAVRYGIVATLAVAVVVNSVHAIRRK